MANGSNTNRYSAPREYSRGSPLTGLTTEVDRQNRDNAYNAAQRNQTGLAALNSIVADGVVNQINGIGGEVVLQQGDNIVIAVNKPEKTIQISATVPPALELISDGNLPTPEVVFDDVTGDFVYAG